MVSITPFIDSWERTLSPVKDVGMPIKEGTVLHYMTTGNFKVMESIFFRARMTSILNQPQLNSTVFLVPDVIINSKYPGLLDKLSPAATNAIANHHILERKIPLGLLDVPSLKVTTRYSRLNTSSPLEVVGDGSIVKIDDAIVIHPDIFANNGVIHVLDDLLIPNLC